MKTLYVIAFVLFLVAIKTQANNTDKNRLIKNIEKNLSTYNKVALKIWEYAEVGFKEEKSSKELITLLSLFLSLSEGTASCAALLKNVSS